MEKKQINKELPYYTKGEEIFNAVTHIVGGGFGIIFFVVSLVMAIKHHLDALGILSVIECYLSFLKKK